MVARNRTKEAEEHTLTLGPDATEAPGPLDTTEAPGPTPREPEKIEVSEAVEAATAIRKEARKAFIKAVEIRVGRTITAIRSIKNITKIHFNEEPIRTHAPWTPEDLQYIEATLHTEIAEMKKAFTKEKEKVFSLNV